MYIYLSVVVRVSIYPRQGFICLVCRYMNTCPINGQEYPVPWFMKTWPVYRQEYTLNRHVQIAYNWFSLSQKYPTAVSIEKEPNLPYPLGGKYTRPGHDRRRTHQWFVRTLEKKGEQERGRANIMVLCHAGSSKMVHLVCMGGLNSLEEAHNGRPSQPGAWG